MTLNRTAIQWTDFTANPIRYKNADGLDVWACSKVSAGCTNCYAETLALSPRMVSKGRALGNKFNDAEMAKLTPYLEEAALRKMLTFKPRGPFRNGERPMVFVGDMTDVFGAWVPDEWLDRLFAVFALRPDVTWQVLTKRPERMRAYMAGDMPERWFQAAKATVESKYLNRFAWIPYDEPFEDASGQMRVRYKTVFHRFPLPNVWLGASVEDQAAADQRIPELLATPAAVRFLSCEPLLGPVDLADYLTKWNGEDSDPEFSWLMPARHGLHQIIGGGESGAGGRPCDLAWLRSLRDQCAAAGVAFFNKQLGSKPVSFGEEYKYRKLRDRHGGDPEEWPEDLRRREWPVSR